MRSRSLFSQPCLDSPRPFPMLATLHPMSFGRSGVAAFRFRRQARSVEHLIRSARSSGLVLQKRGRTTIHAGVRAADDLVEWQVRTAAQTLLELRRSPFSEAGGRGSNGRPAGRFSRRIVSRSMDDHIRPTSSMRSTWRSRAAFGRAGIPLAGITRQTAVAWRTTLDKGSVVASPRPRRAGRPKPCSTHRALLHATSSVSHEQKGDNSPAAGSDR